MLGPERPGIALGGKGEDGGVVRSERAVDRTEERIVYQRLQSACQSGKCDQQRQGEHQQAAAPRPHRWGLGYRVEPLHQPGKGARGHHIQTRRDIERTQTVRGHRHL